ncbi:hypothetical protein ISS07_03120 [Candidatus Woesearchaeota archaeon]|nr:hypothetical protein [Candidatus Woesearchaeota archaeon]
MKGFLLTQKGMEDIAALEIDELVGSKAKQEENCVTFNIKNHEDLFKLAYLSQSALRICYLLSEFSYNDLFKDFEKNIEKVKLDEWISKGDTFRVKCKKLFEHEKTTPDLENFFGGITLDRIEKQLETRPRIELNNPDITLLIFLTSKKCYVGIDFSGDISKRTYNIFASPSAIKAPIAYALVRLCKHKRGIFIDPFSTSGLVPIEAALFFSKFPVNHYNKSKFPFVRFKEFKELDFGAFFSKIDKKVVKIKLDIFNMDAAMKNLNFAKKNSKIAGIDKLLNFSRSDIEFLDAKFDKGAIQSIVTKFPSTKTKNIENLYNEFFYNAEFILKKSGKIVMIANPVLTKKYSEKYKFKILEERKILSGKESYDVFVFEK